MLQHLKVKRTKESLKYATKIFVLFEDEPDNGERVEKPYCSSRDLTVV